jgi:gamma-glutamyltranspeptidase/glutathione hydrolase
MRALDWDRRHASVRPCVLGDAVVATSHPLAVEAGIFALRRGGNAVDAALAAAITLVVVEPTNNGLGSDAFAIVAESDGTLHGLNASGRAPRAMTPERYAGLERMPSLGWDSVTVPGAVSAWVALSQRFGRLDFPDLFADAIRHARDGVAVAPIIAKQWEATAGVWSGFEEFRRVFLPGGHAPRPGQRVCFPDLAASLEEVAETRGESFYRGALGARIADCARRDGGPLVETDLADHRPDWVQPLGQDALRVTLQELPPNGQGLAALEALAILDRSPGRDCDPDSAEGIHFQIEAMKVALADARRWLADPAAMAMSPGQLLDPGYLDARARAIDPDRAGDPGPGYLPQSDTVYLSTADRDGMAVSFIQSNFFGFGSGIVVPGTGISLQNRASGFCLEPGHPNRVGAGKRPFHTIIPAVVTEQGRLRMAFGVMGGPMQPQGHLQMMVRVFGGGETPQAAADAPRWQVMDGGHVAVEEAVTPAVRDELARRGHAVSVMPSMLFGGAQIVLRNDAGGWIAGSDPRKDGYAAAL